MTTNPDAVAAELTVAHERWPAFFTELMDRVADCFPRRETRLTCRDTIEALLTVEGTANCWTLSEAIGHRGPHRLQHFLSRARWDEHAVRAKAAAWAIERLGTEDVVLVADETGDEKSSTDAVGAARQYSGALGGVGLCQVAVHLTYATRAGHTLIDHRLFLPSAWAADEERRELTGVPEELSFATKPQLAVEMLAQLHADGVTRAWVATDEVYGGRETRTAIRALGYSYVIAVKSDHRIRTAAATSTVTDLVKRVPTRSWQRLRTGSGTKGERHYDWAMIKVLCDDTSDDHETGHGTLLVRRHRYTGTVSFYRCWSAARVPLHVLVDVVCRRWRIEEDFQAAKGLTGLDQGQVTTWRSWHRWCLISMISYVLLAVIASSERHHNTTPIPADLVPVSCRELLKLLRILILARPRQDLDPEHALHWSLWRRRHQHRAAACHRRWNEITAASVT
ncbi:IS701 family transposase [Nonomuraea sp. WAC 01424]|uniref:IS701 family transposase n=1 Tax=Nonomuraea sp. WAC 01424 TaxID=2203200 RepID=UPI000F7A444C|nr:IS701 family transposase [Nonomuraea sp. WAC 01424]RSM94891.1 IS701 family transposase [Nonomuraea sp. WAC 01424]